MEMLILTAVRRPVAVIMALTALLLAGFIALSGLPLDRLPPVHVPRILVEAPFPGLGARELRGLVALPLEDALSSVKGLVGITSMARDGRVSLTLSFRWGENPERAALRVREAVDAVWPALPSGLEKPLVLPLEAANEPLMVVAVSPGSGADIALARRLADRELRTRLRRVEGVSSVILVGGAATEAVVSLDLARAAARSLTAPAVAALVSDEIAEIPAGKIPEGEKEVVLVASGRPSSLEELSRLLLPASSGPVRLDEVAEVRPSNASRESLFLKDGGEAVALEVRCRPDSDPVACARALRAEITRARADLAPAVQVSMVLDGSSSIVSDVAALAQSALLGAAISIILILLFLKDLRASLLSILTIPLALAATLVALKLTGRTLNSLSIGGIALGIGLISDNAVVVLSSLSAAFSARFVPPSEAEVSRQVSTVSMSTLSGSLTTVVVFTPVLFLPGPIGALFSDVALTLIVAILTSWAIALFALPPLYRAFWRSLPPLSGKGYERVYRQGLSRALRHPRLAFALAVIPAGIGLFPVMARGLDMAPTALADRVTVSARFPPGTRLEAIAGAGALLLRTIAPVNGVTACFARAGAEPDDLAMRADPGYERESLSVTCLLAPGHEPSAVLPSLREAAASAASGARIAVSLPPDPVSRILGLPEVSDSVRLRIRGRDPIELESRLSQALREFCGLSGADASSLEIEPREFRDEILVTSRSERAARLELSLAEITEALRVASEGVALQGFEVRGVNVPLRIRGDMGVHRELRERETRLEAIPVAIGAAGPIPAAAVAAFSRSRAAASALRVDRADTLYLLLRAAPGRGTLFSSGLDRLLERLPFLERVEKSAVSSYASTLLLTLALVALLLYLLLAAQFESFILPLLVLACLPLALFGAAVALAVFGLSLDSGSLIGLVVLFGTAISNSLVMYELSFSLAARGLGWGAAAWLGAARRLRAVLVTSLTTALALVPVVILAQAGASRSMAVALLGGTVSATLFSLFLSPLLFARFARYSGKGGCP